MSEEGSSLMDIEFNKEEESPNEGKAIESVVLREGEILFETINNNGNDMTAYGLHGQGVLQVQQQVKPKENVVCWESLLNVRSVRVLLVENDDSTRNIISALLRNCNYEVVEAANGLQAWMVLEDLTDHIDLVLTEAVMPCVSGISLLCKIMSHKTQKNIPVIMMSFRDSMSIVFKCLSKGAAGFLIKPIRKNELKNLWQHIWRRSHNSSGSWKKAQKSIRSKGRNNFHKIGSYDGANNKSNGLDVGDGSEDGSDAQSSWTKQAVEVGSSENHVFNRPVSCVRIASLLKIPAQMLKPLATECC